MELWHVPVLAAGGFLCGIINALAGGGSFVTLPLLMMIGLPPQIANATNRVAITLQCLAGTATYHKHKVLLWGHLARIAIPTVMGSVLGAYLSVEVDETIFRRIAAVLFVFMIATVFINPKKWAKKDSIGEIKAIYLPLYFLMGIYGGFLQAGLGTLLISSFVIIGGYDVVRGNALKFALAFTFTLGALLVFTGMGQVQWIPGLSLAIGTITGGIVGAKIVIKDGARWVRWVVVLSAIGAIIKLLTS